MEQELGDPKIRRKTTVEEQGMQVGNRGQGGSVPPTGDEIFLHRCIAFV